MEIFVIARPCTRSLTASDGTGGAAGAGSNTEIAMENDGYQPSDESQRQDSEPSKKGGEPQGFDDVDLSISADPNVKYRFKDTSDVESAKKKKAPGAASEGGKSVPSWWFLLMVVLLGIGFFLALGLGLALGHPDPKLDPYQFTQGAVASDDKLCSEVGRDFLKNGGNAIDATVATAFCLGVLNLHVGGIGGGGYLTFYNRSNAGQANVVITAVIDSQVVAPAGASSDMFSTSDEAEKGGMAIAVPGEVAGLYKAHQTLGGVLSWASLLEPSIRLAKGGFPINVALANAIQDNADAILSEPSLKEILATGDVVKTRGERIVLPKLAATLETIAASGADGFYKGDLAREIVKDVNETGGNITLADLQNYSALTKDPVSIVLGGGQLYASTGQTVYAPPPPSSGIVTNYILNILEDYELYWRSTDNTENEVQTYHRMLEAFKFAFAERTQLGDPDFEDSVSKVVSRLGMTSTAQGTKDKIAGKALPFADYGSMYAPQTDPAGGATHVSVRDNKGNAVSYTTSISRNFGAMRRGSRTGIMFNAGMSDFSLPSSGSIEGLDPSPVNFIKPGKRPLSSMSPLIVVDSDNDVKAVIGASGGSEMITSTAMMAAQILWFEENVIDAMSRARIHSELRLSNEVVTYNHEDTLENDVVDGLESREQVEDTSPPLTSAVNLIMQTKKNRWYTNSDSRVPDSGYAKY